MSHHWKNHFKTCPAWIILSLLGLLDATSSLIKQGLFTKLDTWWYFTSPLLFRYLKSLRIPMVDDPTTINIPCNNNLHPYPPPDGGYSWGPICWENIYSSRYQPIVPLVFVPQPHVWHHRNHTMKRRTLTKPDNKKCRLPENTPVVKSQLLAIKISIFQNIP